MSEYSGLSNEELIELLMQAEEKNKSLSAELEKERKNSENKNKENLKLQDQVRVMDALLLGVAKMVKYQKDHIDETVALAKEFLIDTEDEIGKEFKKEIAGLIEKLSRLLEKNQDLAAMLFGQKSEKSRTTSAETPEEVAAEAQKEKERMKNYACATQEGKALALLKKMAAFAAKKEDGSKDPFVKAAQTIAAGGEEIAKRQGRKEKKTGGKVRNIDHLRKGLPLQSRPVTQCTCGSRDMERIGFLEDLLKADYQAMLKKYERFVAQPTKYIFYKCGNCGKIHFKLAESQPFPILPNRQVTVSTLLGLMAFMYGGTPLSNACRDFEEGAELGNDTVSRSVHELAHYYFKPLVDALIARQKEFGILAADETTWDILQLQGKGNRGQAPAEEEKVASQCYLLALSGEENGARIQIFHPMRGRGAKEIARFITKDYRFKFLLADAYGAYSQIMDEHPDAQRQACLVHWRRELLKAIVPQKLLSEFEKADTKELEKLFGKKLKDHNVFTAFLHVLDGISHIYAYTRLIKQDPANKDYYLAQRRELMDAIDVLMKDVSADRVVPLSTGRYKKKTDNQVSKACVYYMNQREKLRVFVENPEIMPDSNIVERMIRSAVVYRRSALFNQSEDYARTFTYVYSLFRTLELNGITDQTAWLEKYCAAVFEHILSNEVDLNAHDGEGNPMALQIRTDGSRFADSPHYILNLMKTFDVKPWVEDILTHARRKGLPLRG